MSSFVNYYFMYLLKSVLWQESFTQLLTFSLSVHICLHILSQYVVYSSTPIWLFIVVLKSLNTCKFSISK